MSDEKEAVITKIRALLAKSTAAGASEAEAASAAEVAHRLLAKHALSMVDVERSRIAPRKTGLRYLDPWIRNIAVHGARLYGCEPLIVTERAETLSRKTGQKKSVFYSSVTVYGREVSTEVAVSMINYLVDTVVRMSRDYSRDRKTQLQFQRGAGERVASRIWEMQDRSRGEAMEGANTEQTGTSLIVVEQCEAKEWLMSNMETKKYGGRESDTSSWASLDGWNQGGTIQIGGQVGTAGGRSTALPAR